MGQHQVARTATFTTFLTALLVALFGAPALAGTYGGTSTGYAMGATSGGGGSIYQTDFANHYSGWCPNDPSAYWSFGSRIQYDSAIAFYDANDDWYPNDKSWLRDVGDPTCSQGNYWVDLYFGRYKLYADTCSCPGVSNSVCSIASSNSCTRATQFGSSTYGYDKIQ